MSNNATFESTDKLGLQGYCRALERFLLVEHAFVVDGLVVSLNAPFGTGKTTFLQMWKNDLLERRAERKSDLLPLVLNAWESDYCGEPLLAIVSAFSKAVEQHKAAPPKKVKALREAAKDAAWFTAGLANEFVSKVGINPIAAGEFAESKKQKRQGKPDLLLRFEERAEALQKVKVALTSTFGGNVPKAIVFVDELDRCRPDYAIEFLETIKHVFDVRGLVFVLAVDRGQLQSSAKALFGSDLVFEEYYRKFVHRSFDLPEISEDSQALLTDAFIDRFIHTNEGSTPRRISSLSFKDLRRKTISEIFRGLHMTPRQAEEAFRIIGYCGSLDGPTEQRRVTALYTAGLFFMAALAVGKNGSYHRIGKKTMPLQEFSTLLQVTFPKRSHGWWGCVLLSAYVPLEDVTRDASDFLLACEHLGIINKGDNAETAIRYTGQYYSQWGDGETGQSLTYIYRMIEGLSQFLCKS